MTLDYIGAPREKSSSEWIISGTAGWVSSLASMRLVLRHYYDRISNQEENEAEQC